MKTMVNKLKDEIVFLSDDDSDVKDPELPPPPPTEGVGGGTK